MTDAPDHMPREFWMDEHGVWEFEDVGSTRYVRSDVAKRWRIVLERMSEGGPYEHVWIPDELHEEIQKALKDE